MLFFTHSVLSKSFATLYTTRLLSPRNFPDKNSGVNCHFLIQGVFLNQGLIPYLLHWQVDSLPLGDKGSPERVYILKYFKIKKVHFSNINCNISCISYM